MQTANTAAWELDLSTRSVFVTKNFETVLAFSPSFPINPIPYPALWRVFRKQLSNAQEFSLKQAFSRAILEHEPFTLSFLINISENQKKWFRISAEPQLIEGKTLKIAGTIKDISDTKEKEKDIHYADIITNNIQMMIFRINEKGLIIDANHHAIQKLGFPKTELIGTSIKSLNSQYTKKIWSQLWKSVRRGRSYNAETFFKSKEQQIIPVRLNAGFSHYMQESYIFLFAQDITEEIQATQKVQYLQKQLDELVYIKKENGIKPRIRLKHRFPNIITRSETYKQVLQEVEQVAPTLTPVLILGETGTGKELLAEAVHELSDRNNRPFIKVNCASLPENLIESELFGHEKGAFTGAIARKPGRFELANRGTLFLDEIGELPLHLQPKLLRALQDGTFERVGGTQTLRVDTRIVAATNQNLAALAAESKFRQDLFYRLNVFPIYNIPLRERKDDIPVLTNFFLKKYAELYKKPLPLLSKAQIAEMLRYHYPGNVRELENIIQRAVIRFNGTQIDLNFNAIRKVKIQEAKEEFKSFEKMQRDYILKALEMTNWRVSGPFGAAKLLELNPNTLETKMRRLGIKRPK